MLKLHWEYIKKKRKGGIVYSFWYKLRLYAQCAQEHLDCSEKEVTCGRRRRKEEWLVESGHRPHALKSRNSSLIRRYVWEHKNGKNYDLKNLYGPIFYVYPKLSNRLKYWVFEARLLHVPDPEMAHLICCPGKDLWSFSDSLGSLILYL